MKPKLTTRISDLGKSLKTGISEKFQLGVEAEFGRMFFFVVLLFYITWTTIVVSVHMCMGVCAYVHGCVCMCAWVCVHGCMCVCVCIV